MEYPARPMTGVIPPNPGKLQVAEHPPPLPQLTNRPGQITPGLLLQVGLSAGTVTEQVEDLPVRVGDRNTRHGPVLAGGGDVIPCLSPPGRPDVAGPSRSSGPGRTTTAANLVPSRRVFCRPAPTSERPRPDGRAVFPTSSLVMLFV